ncbi:MAG TPA: alpha-ketoglutarate-dependent dioxygenase AlkB [Kofleriaceae bacterium]|nr:alpha-ketoglutarate-dependent dioxygenase AlkB [Kofleriaceae bacterium]
MARQLDLFAAPSIGFDPAFAGLRRTELADGAWVDYVPGWVRGHDALFDQLERSLTWRTERRRMYDRVVPTPRLLASVPADGLIEELRRALSARYGEDFVRTTAALYRDGDDGVAWHGDTTARDMDRAIVATVSLGQPRRFLLRPAAGLPAGSGPSIGFQLGRGDLLVMGGTCQRTWRHAIPKVARALGPRIAVMFRPMWGGDEPTPPSTAGA